MSLIRRCSSAGTLSYVLMLPASSAETGVTFPSAPSFCAESPPVLSAPPLYPSLPGREVHHLLLLWQSWHLLSPQVPMQKESYRVFNHAYVGFLDLSWKTQPPIFHINSRRRMLFHFFWSISICLPFNLSRCRSGYHPPRFSAARCDLLRLSLHECIECPRAN